MSKIKKALELLRKEEDSESKNNVLEQFNGVCLHCCTEEVLVEIEVKLEKYLRYYGYNEIADNMVKDEVIDV